MQSKMWACLRELKTRKESLDALDLEIESTQDNIELLDISHEKIIKDMINDKIHEDSCDWNTKKEDFYEECFQDNVKNERFEKEHNLVLREKNIKIRQIARQKKSAEASIKQLLERKKWLEEESRFFLETFKHLQNLEPLKNFDDFESQKEYWHERLSQKLHLKMLTTQQLDTELIETIIALPEDMQLKKNTVANLQLRHAQMIQSKVKKEVKEENKES